MYEEVIEVSCRVIPVSERCQLESHFYKRTVIGATSEELYVISELDDDDTISKLKELKKKGIKSVAVALMHSYT